jgi:hypothetical protein
MPASLNYSVARIAGIIAAVLFAVVIVLQILLAAGVLPISMAWGGQRPVLTTGLRLASVAAVVILVLFAYVICRRAGLFSNNPTTTAIKFLSWIVTAFLVLNTIGNLTSKSTGERMLFSPITILLVVSCSIVSVSKSRP